MSGGGERAGVEPRPIMVTRGGSSSSSSPSSSCMRLVSTNQAGGLKSDHDQDRQGP